MDPGNSSRRVFASVVDEQRDMVYRIAYNRTRSHHDADDVTQEVFVKLWQRPEVWRSGDANHLRFWLIRVTIRTCASLARRLHRGPTELTEGTIAKQGDGDPEPALLEQERVAEVRRALLSLPTSYRTILQLYYEFELSTPQIAKVLNMPQATVRTKLARGRKRLKQLLEPNKPETEAYHGRAQVQESCRASIQ